MPYRSASITCIRHPLTAASSSCSVCGHEVCGECGTWLALRFRCLDCAARYRRWQKFRGRIGRVALMLPLVATLMSVGALAVARPTPRYLPFVERDIPTANVVVERPRHRSCHCFPYKGGCCD